MKYIEKIKTVSLNVPNYYMEKLDAILHDKNHEEERQELAKAFPNSFLFQSPDLLKDFVSMKDLTVNPLTVPISSDLYVNWKCHVCGHKWQSEIRSRIARKHGRQILKESDGTYKVIKCKYCGYKGISQKITIVEKDASSNQANYADKYPVLRKIFDENLNGIPVDKLTFHNFSDTIYCKCEKHGEYALKFSSIVYNLQRGINPCAVCRKESKQEQGKVSLAVSHPELCQDWSDKNEKGPEDYLTGSNKKVIWECHICSYEWEKSINDRVRNPSCPNCRKNRNLIIKDKELYEKIKSIYDTDANDIPLEKLKTTDKCRVNLICQKHGKYSLSLATVLEKIKNGIDPCKYCANPSKKISKRINKKQSKKVSKPRYKNTFASKHPNLAIEWSPRNAETPDKVAEFSKKVVWWECKNCSTEWQARVLDRARGFKACPKCYPFGIKGGKRLADVRPDLRKYYSEENSKSFDKLSSASNEKVIWVCEHGHKLENTVDYMANREGFTCPKCAGLIAGEDNNFAVNHPDLLEEWDYEKNNKIGLDPSKIMDGSHALAYWKCRNCSSSYQLRLNRKIIYECDGTIACPYCRGDLVNETNCIKTTHPKLMDEWLVAENTLNGVFASKINDKYDGKVWWQCPDCGYKYTMTATARCMKEKRKQCACPRCNGRLQKRLHFF